MRPALGQGEHPPALELHQSAGCHLSHRASQEDAGRETSGLGVVRPRWRPPCGCVTSPVLTLPRSPSDLLPGAGAGLGRRSSDEGSQAQWPPQVLSLHAPGPAQALAELLLCPRAEPRPSVTALSPLCPRAQRGSWPGRSAGATGTALQTALHGHVFQGERQPHPGPSGSEAPEEAAAEEDQRAAAAPQAPGDLW